MKTDEWKGLASNHVRLSKELQEIVEREAHALGMKVTEFIRFSVISYLRSINVPVHPSEEHSLKASLEKQIEEESVDGREEPKSNAGEGG